MPASEACFLLVMVYESNNVGLLASMKNIS